MLSIVIVNWNTREHLRRCLGSIVGYPPTVQYEVVVVDNGSEDGSAVMVREEFPSARLISNEENLGYAAASNQGFSESKGDLILTLNPDTEFFDDSLDKAVVAISELREVGALAGKLMNPDGSLQLSIRSFPTPGAIVWDMAGLSRLFPKSRVFGAYRQTFFDYSKAQEAEQPMGTFILYRKEALDEVGLMDEQFPIFFNEVDLLLRLKRAGWKIWYTPEVQLIHYGAGSTKQVRKRMIWESHNSLLRFYRKWYVRWWNLPLFWLFAALVWLGALIRARGWDAGFRH